MLNYQLDKDLIPTDYLWTQVPGSLKQISVGFQEQAPIDPRKGPTSQSYRWNMWGINSLNEIWRWPQTFDKTNDYLVNVWEPILGSLVQVSIGPYSLAGQPTPTVWGVNQNDEIWRWRGGWGTGNYWDRIEGSLRRISVGAAGVWGVNQNGDAYCWMGGGGTANSWQRVNVPSPLSDIAVADWDVWGITQTGQVIRRSALLPIPGLNSNWAPVTFFDAAQIAGSETDLCIVTKQGEVWSWRGSNDWLWLTHSGGFPVKFKQVSVGVLPVGATDHGTIWAVDIIDGIWRWKYSVVAL